MGRGFEGGWGHEISREKWNDKKLDVIIPSRCMMYTKKHPGTPLYQIIDPGDRKKYYPVLYVDVALLIHKCDFPSPSSSLRYARCNRIPKSCNSFSTSATSLSLRSLSSINILFCSGPALHSFGGNLCSSSHTLLRSLLFFPSSVSCSYSNFLTLPAGVPSSSSNTLGDGGERIRS